MQLVRVQNGFLPANPQAEEEMKNFPVGELVEMQLKITENYRSLQQLNLYWWACHLVAMNTENRNWDSKEKVSEQIKIACQFIDHWILYENPKTKEKWLNIKTKSISFSSLSHAEACKFFDKAFDLMAEIMGLDVDTFIEKVKAQIVLKNIVEAFNGDVIK